MTKISFGTAKDGIFSITKELILKHLEVLLIQYVVMSFKKIRHLLAAIFKVLRTRKTIIVIDNAFPIHNPFMFFHEWTGHFYSYYQFHA